MLSRAVTFKHALTHEVAYQGLLQDRWRTLHARIVEAIEHLSAVHVAEQAERLAHHALRGELWEKAVVYLRQSGLRAMAQAANRQAVAHFEQALVALSKLRETRETTEQTTDIRVDLRNALLPLGDWTRMGEHLHEAEMLARSVGDQRRLGRIATFMVIQCQVRAAAAGAEDAEGYYRQVLALAEPRGMRPLVAHCHLGLGEMHHRIGNPAQAQEHLTIAKAMYREMDMAYWLEQATTAMGQLG